MGLPNARHFTKKNAYMYICNLPKMFIKFKQTKFSCIRADWPRDRVDHGQIGPGTEWTTDILAQGQSGPEAD